MRIKSLFLFYLIFVTTVSADQGYYDWRIASWFAGDRPGGFGIIDPSDTLPYGHRITCSSWYLSGGGEISVTQTDEALTDAYQELGFNLDNQIVPHVSFRSYGEPQFHYRVHLSLSFQETDDLYILLFDVDEQDRFTIDSDIPNDLWEVAGLGDVTLGGGAAPGPNITLSPPPNAGAFEINSTQNVDSDMNFIALKPKAPISYFNLQLPSDVPPVADFRMGLYLLENRTTDFDGNGRSNCSDLDRLISRIAEGDYEAQLDLNDDDRLDNDDISEWLEEAGYANIGRPYLMGDANLDGFVEVSDFNAWNSHKFTEQASWCRGDFSADGVVDVTDFNIWNENKFQPTTPSPVPEPRILCCWFAFGAFMLLKGIRRA